MSHFKVEVEVPKGKLEQFMRATVGPWSMSIKEYVENGESAPVPVTKRGKKRGAKRGTPETHLTMTGKVPLIKTGLLAKGLKVFEQLETAQGIGAITVKVFRTKLVTERMKYTLQTRLLHEGYLDYLD